MKHLANSISIVRIILSILLIFIFNNPGLFIAVYLLCGFSDILDGYIARKTQTQSVMGAKLDSIGDFLLFSVITIIMILMVDEIQAFIPLITAIALIRLINLFYSKCKYKQFALIHTYANKITGLLVFIMPIAYVITKSNVVLIIICIVSILS